MRNLKTSSTYESCALSIAFQQRITRLVSTNGSKTRAKTVPKIAKIKKTEFRDLVNSKLLLNRNELEKIINMKKMRLDDIFPTVYHLLHSDERFRIKRENTLAASCHARTVFEISLKPRRISKSVQHDEAVHFP